jgi:Predicted periplasmic lipoprotein (DUF2279)
MAGAWMVLWFGLSMVPASAESSGTPPSLGIGGLVPSDDDTCFLTSPAIVVREEILAEGDGFANLEAFAGLRRRFLSEVESPGIPDSRGDNLASPRFNLVSADRGARDTGLLPSTSSYSIGRFSEQTMSAKWEFAGIFAAISAIGFANWDWFSSGFNFNNEGWFKENTTGSGGMDKLGHAFATYVMTDILTHAIRRNSSDPRGGEFTAALLATSLMTYVEVFDGFSGDHGFSYEDLVMDILGAGLSVMRNAVPGLREKLDFRMQYLTSPHSSFEPFGDYEGQKFFVVVKFAGFENLQDTPLRFVELHGGYLARGFSSEEERAGTSRERNMYVGIGLNLQELLFGKVDRSREHWAAKSARVGLEYVQIPYTYASTGGNSGR